MITVIAMMVTALASVLVFYTSQKYGWSKSSKFWFGANIFCFIINTLIFMKMI